MSSSSLKLAGAGLLLLIGCRANRPSSVSPEDATSRMERALAGALRWIPTNPDNRSVPVVLMAGQANGHYRQEWIDSLKMARTLDHDCHAITVMECKDSTAATYVQFGQPKLGDESSAEVPLVIAVLNPATCHNDSTPYTEVSGVLSLPTIDGSVADYRLNDAKTTAHHC